MIVELNIYIYIEADRLKHTKYMMSISWVIKITSNVLTDIYHGQEYSSFLKPGANLCFMLLQTSENLHYSITI